MSSYNHQFARNPRQAKRMKELEQRSICAFCREHVEQETNSPIELENDNWIVKANDYPYDGASIHLLVIPKRHVKTISDLPISAMQDYLKIVSEAEQLHHLTSYALTMRSGDMRFNGGTVEHLHAHIIVGDTANPEHKPIKFKVSSRPD